MSYRYLRLAAAGALAIASVAAVATPSQAARTGDAHRFATWTGYEVGIWPASVATGDFDGDGSTDAAWGHDGDFALTVTLNLGEGTLGSTTSYEASTNTRAVTAADLDGDTDLDLVSVSGNFNPSSKTIDIFLNDGSGHFSHTTANGGVGPQSLALGDVNDDDVIDIVVPNTSFFDEDHPSDGSVSVLLGDGDGTFAPEAKYATGAQPTDVAVGDFDGDGVVDIASVRSSATNEYAFEVLVGNGDGTFDPDANDQFVQDQTSNPGVGDLAVGDLDGDDDPDLVMGGVSTSKDVVLLNDGTGTFDVTLYSTFGALDPHLSDIDNDGDLDLVSVSGIGGIGGFVNIQRNNGDGTVAAQEQLRTSRNPIGVAVADMDADHRVDILTANRDTGTGAVHLQLGDDTFASPPIGSQFEPALDVTTGDFNDDGDVDVAATGQDSLAVSTIQVFDNNGSADLTLVQTIKWDDSSLNRKGRHVVAGDLDGDTDIDLVWMVNQGSGQRILTSLNDGAGHFANPVPFTMPTCSERFTLADADGDGALDIVMGNEQIGCAVTGFEASIAFNDGSGNFGNKIIIDDMAFQTASVAVADFDGDGLPDLVGGGVANGSHGDLAIALGTGSRTFADPTYKTVGVRHIELAVADFEADGDPDIASMSFGSSFTTVLVNDGSAHFDGTSLKNEEIIGFRNTVGIAVGDVTGDTIPDVLVANETGSDIALNAGNGDGTFDPSQVRFGMRPTVTDVEFADLNGDGVNDIISTAQVPPGGRVGDAVDGKGGGGVSVLLSKAPKCTIKGTKGNDTLKGTRKADVICGRGGNDVITGLGSGDIIIGGGGNDTIDGGDGVDIIVGGGGNDTVNGGSGNDSLSGGKGTDKLHGDEGVDNLDGLDRTRGNDTVDGGKSTDHCRADKKDTVTSC